MPPIKAPKPVVPISTLAVIHKGSIINDAFGEQFKVTSLGVRRHPEAAKHSEADEAGFGADCSIMIEHDRALRNIPYLITLSSENTSASSKLGVENSRYTAPSSPASNACFVCFGNNTSLPGAR